MPLKKQQYIAGILILVTIIVLAVILSIRKDENPELMSCRTRLTLMEKNEEFKSSVIGRNLSAAADHLDGKGGLVFISGGGKAADETLRSAAEYYIGRMDSLPEMKRIKIIFACKLPGAGGLEDNFKTGRSPATVILSNKNSNVFMSFLPSGVNAAVILLDMRGVCIYAHTLEAENSRRIYENSGPITELIRNGI
jgi:hypothetical protein